GVSTRNYRRSLEPLPNDLKSSSTSKSSVSRRFVEATAKQLQELLSLDLSPLAIATVIIDGIHVGEHVVLVALGIDESGTKQVLGLHEGATENSAACIALMESLVAR